VSRTILLAALPVLAAFALFQRRRWVAVLGMGLISFLLAVVYALQGAPDVAVAEAAIGAALVTFIYILAIRRTGRLTVIAPEVSGLLFRQQGEITGVESELLGRFAREIGLDLTVRFAPYDEAVDTLRRGGADILAGGMVADVPHGGLLTESYLPTRFYRVGAEGGPSAPTRHRDEERTLPAALRAEGGLELDLVRLLALTRRGLGSAQVAPINEEAGYAFVVHDGRPDLHDRLNRFLDRLRETDELRDLAERHLG
jgi:uncharacterized MnhB-related membrane protein